MLHLFIECDVQTGQRIPEHLAIMLQYVVINVTQRRCNTQYTTRLLLNIYPNILETIKKALEWSHKPNGPFISSQIIFPVL